MNIYPETEKLLNDIKLRIYTICQENAGSVPAAAKEIGINKSTMYAYIEGANTPSLPAIIQLCTMYNINAEWLIFGEGEVYH